MEITPETTKPSIAYPSFAKMAAVAATSFAVCPAEEEQSTLRTEGAVPYEEMEQRPQRPRQHAPKQDASVGNVQDEQQTGGYLPEDEVIFSPRRHPSRDTEPVAEPIDAPIDEPITEPEDGGE